MRLRRIRRGLYFFGVFAGLVALFFVYSFLSLESQGSPVPLFNSPDETANYHFSRIFAETGMLSYREELLKPSQGFVHPRSMTVAGESVVPVSFIGLPVIYGSLARLFGVGVIPFLTPFFAVLAVPFFFFLIASIFGRKVAFLSSVLLLIHPAYWYYASRSLLPNVLFVDLVIIGLSVLILTLRSNASLPVQATSIFDRAKSFFLSLPVRGVVSGFALGLALTVRFSEATWIFPLVLAIVVFHYKKLKLAFAVPFLVSIVLSIGILFYFNEQVYGNPLIFGYQTLNMVPSAVALEQSLDIISSLDASRLSELGKNMSAIFGTALAYVLPFGVVPSTFSVQFVDYFIKMFWWFSIPLLFGCIIAIRNGLSDIIQKRSYFIAGYLFATTAVGAWLIVYYGSWTVVDNIAHEVTVGNAYVRYWLPLTIASLPLAALAFVTLFDGLRSRPLKFFAVGSLALALLYSFHATLWQSSDSLFEVRKRLGEYVQKRNDIITIVPKGAVIVSARSDKIFFPERRAAQHFDGFAEAPLIPLLLQRVPVYYYGFWDPELASGVSHKYFEQHGVALRFVKEFEGKEYLYQAVLK